MNWKETILQDFKLKDSDIVNVYPYGSQVYGTASVKSDYDFIVVLKNGTKDGDSLESSYHNLNVSLYSEDSFQDQVNRHKIAALECIFLPVSQCPKISTQFKLKLDKKILRESISEKASHSWVKAKKKFEVEVDRNVYVAKKSLFHSLRIIEFGTQIAIDGAITNYSSANYLWDEIVNDPSDTWEPYKTKYQHLYNEWMTEFRKRAPK